jgi:hypothetical protein
VVFLVAHYPIMSAPNDTVLQLSDRRLEQKLHAELKDIAGAMGLDNTLNKGPLLRSIQKEMKEKPQLADDPRFTPLFSHRANPKASSEKTSAVKEAEDASEGAKPPKAATG